MCEIVVVIFVYCVACFGRVALKLFTYRCTIVLYFANGNEYDLVQEISDGNHYGNVLDATPTCNCVSHATHELVCTRHNPLRPTVSMFSYSQHVCCTLMILWFDSNLINVYDTRFCHDKHLRVQEMHRAIWMIVSPLVRRRHSRLIPSKSHCKMM